MPTTDRLFPPRNPADDIGAYAPFLARARSAGQPGSTDESARCALGAYLVLRLLERVLATDSGEPSEGLEWQTQSTMRFLQDLPSEGPEPAHLLGLVEAVALEPRQRRAVVRLSLIAYAFYLEQEGRYEEALEVLSVAANTGAERVGPSEMVSLGLQVARLNRHLARWDEAVRCYRLARALAESAGDARAVFLARLGEANVRRGRGDLPGAREDVEGIIRDAGSLQQIDVQARAYHDLAAVLDRQGRPHEAVLAGYRAFELYQDPLDRCRALGDLGVILRNLGCVDAARYAFETVARQSESWPVRLNAIIGLMELESAIGNELGFRRYAQIAGDAERQMAPSAAIDFHYNLGIGWARMGRLTRAKAELQTALGMAEAHRLHEWCFRVERVLLGIGECVAALAAERGVEIAPPAELGHVTEGLKRYAALSYA